MTATPDNGGGDLSGAINATLVPLTPALVNGTLASGYELYYVPTSDANASTLSKDTAGATKLSITDPNATTAQLTDLTPGTEYTFVVYAKNQNGAYSQVSDAVQATSSAAPAASILGHQVAKGTAIGTTKITYAATAGNTLAYKVQGQQFGTVYKGLAPTGTTAYTTGADIAATAGQWIGLYELDGADNVVKFVQHQVIANDLASVGVTATKGATTSGLTGGTSATWVLNEDDFIVPTTGSSLDLIFNGVTITLFDGSTSAVAVLEDDTEMDISGTGAIEPVKAASQTNPVKGIKIGYDASKGGSKFAAFYVHGMLKLVIDPEVNSPLKDFAIANESSNITFTAPAGTAYNDRQFTGSLFDVSKVTFAAGTAGNVTNKASVDYTFTGATATGQITVTLANPAKTVNVNVTAGQSAADVAEAIKTALGTVDGYTVVRSGATLTFTTDANAASADVTVSVN